MLGAVLKIVGPLVTGFMENRQKVSAAKADLKIQRLQGGIPGYSDEVLIFIWSAPFVLSFIPGLQEYAQAGFEHLAALPDWYVGGFISITFAVFGIDKLFSFKKV
jgi:uncharacterized membrane protein YciS (DUF1049 family)|tara:strand:- start:303 stop:617 length:315 start_codon:yes stop_codon:yes gene_type:complete